jgi:DNA end-binding protein Ku
VQPFEEAPDTGSANVVDLTELLRQSLGGKSGKGKAPARKAPAAKASRGRKAA